MTDLYALNKYVSGDAWKLKSHSTRPWDSKFEQIDNINVAELSTKHAEL